MTAPVLDIRKLAVIRNGMPALDVPSLSFEEGRICALIGPNGAGKTTLLLSLMGLVRSAAGAVSYRGRPVVPGGDLTAIRRKMSLVFQEPLLFDASVYGNIAAGLKMRGMTRARVKEGVGRAMDLLGIAHLAGRRAHALSGGEAQRVNLARALAVEPDVLLMDEPFSALDAPSREALITDLDRIVRGKGITAIFATHDRGEAIRLADRIVVMNGGIVAQDDEPNTIMQYPADEFVASFMGTETILTGTVVASARGLMTVDVDGVTVEAAGSAGTGSRVTICVSPESIVLSGGTKGTSARNSFRGRVDRIVPLGLYQKVYVRCGFMLVAYVTGQSLQALGIREGKKITASFKATAVHIIKIIAS
jgi:tungstate transport system ATP-binding protein